MYGVVEGRERKGEVGSAGSWKILDHDQYGCPLFQHIFSSLASASVCAALDIATSNLTGRCSVIT